MNKPVECFYYGGFQSYGVKPIATKKPGGGDHYQKDAYKEISDYNRRKVGYFEDKSRWNSTYNSDLIQSISEKEYREKERQGLKLKEYEYSHDDNLKRIALNLNSEDRKEDNIREAL